ncbi:hypothetical protein HI914_06810 [Erysiphe necator]|nr:hypothetical protein HI914_06810 [Erysiphe necator]
MAPQLFSRYLLHSDDKPENSMNENVAESKPSLPTYQDASATYARYVPTHKFVGKVSLQNSERK